MPVPDRLVCFAHGKESGPWGVKISRLAEVARGRGFDIVSPDYRHSVDPHRRLAQLLAEAPRAAVLVLVGSSMGGYVSAHACRALRPRALYLMAPALYFPGWEEEPEAIPPLCAVAHGWGDTVVPLAASLRFAERHRAELLVLDSDHGLNDQLPALSLQFDALLHRALEPS